MTFNATVRPLLAAAFFATIAVAATAAGVQARADLKRGDVQMTGLSTVGRQTEARPDGTRGNPGDGALRVPQAGAAR